MFYFILFAEMTHAENVSRIQLRDIYRLDQTCDWSLQRDTGTTDTVL